MSPSGTLRVLPLGGLGEIGKNMMVVEYDDRVVVVDTGLMFPTPEQLGIDLVLPDFAYLRERADDIDAIVLTHGHEDHVGALPYLMREVDIPEVWATRLTLGLVKSKLDEHGLLRGAELVEIEPEKGAARLGPYSPLALAAARPCTHSTSPTGRISSGPSARYMARASINTVERTLWPHCMSARARAGDSVDRGYDHGEHPRSGDGHHRWGFPVPLSVLT